MKGDRPSEEKLMIELESMYRRVADLEGGERPEGQITDKAGPSHEKIIPFPQRRIHPPSGKALEELTKQKRKPSYRPYRIIAFLCAILLGFILVVGIVKAIIAPWGLEKGDKHQITSPGQSTSSPTIQKGQGASQENEEKIEKAESIPREIRTVDPPITQKGYYAVQVGAFRTQENAQDLVEALKKKGVRAYWMDMGSRNGVALYKVFSGHFTDKNEAARSIKETGLLNDYPDSFVQEVSPGTVRFILSNDRRD